MLDATRLNHFSQAEKEKAQRAEAAKKEAARAQREKDDWVAQLEKTRPKEPSKAIPADADAKDAEKARGRSDEAAAKAKQVLYTTSVRVLFLIFGSLLSWPGCVCAVV